jgi:hypothetical protein
MFLNKLWQKYKQSAIYKHETKHSALFKFIILFIIILLYFGFMSYKYGLKDGFITTLITWSFFVFCTPIADAGFLLDFPIRLLLKVRMIYSEMLVWGFAIIINILTFYFIPQIYEKNIILQMFKTILLNPWPYYSIITISAFGTYLSIYFGDELMDVMFHKERAKYMKHKIKYFIILGIFLFMIIIFLYKHILTTLGIKI